MTIASEWNMEAGLLTHRCTGQIDRVDLAVAAQRWSTALTEVEVFDVLWDLGGAQLMIALHDIEMDADVLGGCIDLRRTKGQTTFLVASELNALILNSIMVSRTHYPAWRVNKFERAADSA